MAQDSLAQVYKSVLSRLLPINIIIHVVANPRTVRLSRQSVHFLDMQNFGIFQRMQFLYIPKPIMQWKEFFMAQDSLAQVCKSVLGRLLPINITMHVVAHLRTVRLSRQSVHFLDMQNFGIFQRMQFL
jgi:hypothetical protein